MPAAIMEFTTTAGSILECGPLDHSFQQSQTPNEKSILESTSPLSSRPDRFTFALRKARRKRKPADVETDPDRCVIQGISDRTGWIGYSIVVCKMLSRNHLLTARRGDGIAFASLVCSDDNKDEASTIPLDPFEGILATNISNSKTWI
jgi:hypothetical protein